VGCDIWLLVLADQRRTVAKERDTMKVPQSVYDGIEAVRQSGVTNMLARDRVAEEAGFLGFGECQDWIYANEAEYAKGVFEGFEVDGP